MWVIIGFTFTLPLANNLNEGSYWWEYLWTVWYSKPFENSKNKAITVDGGKTWTLVADGQSPNYKSCVQYVPNTNGKEVFAVGKTGVSYSKDGGLNWNDINKESYYSIQFVDRNTAWLSGNNKIGKLILP